MWNWKRRRRDASSKPSKVAVGMATCPSCFMAIGVLGSLGCGWPCPCGRMGDGTMIGYTIFYDIIAQNDVHMCRVSSRRLGCEISVCRH